MEKTAAFWDRLAERYAARPVSDQTSYETTLERVRLRLRPDDRVLEVGCGTGSTALSLAGAVGRLTATDFAPKMIEIAQRKAAAAGVANVDFAVADADAPQAGADYDAVLAFNLLHLAPDPAALCAVAHGALRPGGLFISKTVCLGGKAWLFGPMIGAMRLIGKAPKVHMLRIEALDAMIEAAGFEILETGIFPKSPPSRFVVAQKR